MKKVNIKKISIIVLTIVFVFGMLFVVINSSILISNNIKSNNYMKAFGFYYGDNAYYYSVDADNYKCKVNSFKVGTLRDTATVKYNPKKHEECVVVLTDKHNLTGATIVSFLLGLALIVLMIENKKKN